MLENPFYHDEDAKRERGFLRRTLIVPLVLAICAGLVTVWATKAHSETYSAQSGGDRLTLFNDACQVEWLKTWKKARWFYQGKEYEACWTMVGQIVVTLDPTGEIGRIPMQAFKKDVGV